jgi:magnesium chelatase family protein
MLSKVLSGVTIGLKGVLIEVETDVSQRGLPTFIIVGLPSKAVDEAKDRVRTAIINTSFEMPDSRVTVNLAPADIPKQGSSFDLPIAIGILAASGMIEKNSLENSMFIGELSLEGVVRKIPGIISIAMMARRKKIKNLFLPYENSTEASLIENLNIYPVKNLAELVLHLNKHKKITCAAKITLDKLKSDEEFEFDYSDIKGQENAKRAFEIAAAGFHNIHIKGPPGAGKTMLSRGFPTLFPRLIKQEVLEVSEIYSASGLIKENKYILSPPFRSPHHTTSKIGLIGGGTIPRPGEISLAHRGILFLDELPEFPRSTLEALRQPMEDGYITISRAQGSLKFPCRFLLVAASNPCPCGYLGHPKKSCKCSNSSIIKYRKKISGPLLDRIDLHVLVPPVENKKLVNSSISEKSVEIKKRVVNARKKQLVRFKESKIKTNGEMQNHDLNKYCKLENQAIELLKQAVAKLVLSARSYTKVIKIAQTISDLDNLNIIKASHVAEALQYRMKEE